MPGRSREQNISGSSGIGRHGGGIHGGGGGGDRGFGRNPLVNIIILIAILAFGGGGLGSFLGGDDSGSSPSSYGSFYQTAATSWTREKNTGVLNTQVADGARAKFTTLKGDGSDKVTILVYMCGADLESRNGMGTSDLKEMIAGVPSGNVNLLVYTGGAKRWNNTAVSSDVCQIFQVTDEGLKCLVSDDGDRTMTDPDTLTRFIDYGKENFPANRYELILWDHGGGSVSGYGYDEKHASAGSMPLSKIHSAVTASGVKFDAIGFDACLMATAENALSLSDCADYLIASEETEPGTGWYYTNWIRKLTADPGMSTLDLSKIIIDDFVSSGGSSLTLSVTDLAELSSTLSAPLSAFSAATEKEIESDYDTVSKARSDTREFASSSRIDQVDLVHFATNLGTDEGKALSDAVLSAVKYNRTSASMTNAYGLSIYFPYRNLSNVDQATGEYADLGMDESYTDCVKSFAKMEASGQAAGGGMDASSPFPMLSTGNIVVEDLLGQFLSGDPSLLGLTSADFMSEAPLSDDTARSYVESHSLETADLSWSEDADGNTVLSLTDWDQVSALEKSTFVDDGSGYIDLGLDEVYRFNDDGALIADTDGTWLAINGQPVPYYHIDTTEDGDDYTIRGRIPAMLNGTYVNLIAEFTDENPDGSITGYVTDYRDGETNTVAKSIESLNDGDVIDFVATCYDYDGNVDDEYEVGTEVTVDGGAESLVLSDVYVTEKLVLSYRLTDTYGHSVYTPSIELDNSGS